MPSSNQKIAIIKEWSEWFYQHIDSFKGAIGMDLAYLWPAIANDNVIIVSKKSKIVRLLKDNQVPDTASIWRYIDIEE